MRQNLNALNPSVKNNFNQFYDKIIGQSKIGGMSGYLGRYATCAIETEEEGHNKEDHSRSIAVQEVVNHVRSRIEKLGKGYDRIYDTNEENYWSNAIASFTQNRGALIRFFEEEKSLNDSQDLCDLFACYQEFESSAFSSMKQVCNIILQENPRSKEFSRHQQNLNEMSGQFKPRELEKLSKKPQNYLEP